MIKRTITTAILLATAMHQSAFSASGLLFDVTTDGATLQIKSSVPTHTYATAGIKINTPGVAFATTSPGCKMAANGYCLFSVSDQTAANISTTATTGELAFTLCLNGAAALSCQSYSKTLTSSMVTVGSYRMTSGAYVPIGYTSSNGGSTWTLSNGGVSPLVSLPADSWVNSSASAILSTVVCDLTGQRCTSVGVYDQGIAPSYVLKNGRVPLSYNSINGGQSWALSSMPMPADSLTGGSAQGGLNTPICDPSGQKCTAVGIYIKGVAPNYTASNGGVPLSYTSINGGQTWALSASLPLPPDVLVGSSARSRLNNMACDPAGQKCTAVGAYIQGLTPGYTTSNGSAPLSYSSMNGGQTWALSAPLPLPSDVLITSDASSILNSITCDPTGQNCIALGSYTQGLAPGYTVSNGTAPLSYTSTNGGQTWALSDTLPVPADAVRGTNALIGAGISIACDPTGVICAATCSYRRGSAPNYNVSIGRVPVGYTSNNGGRTWSLSNMPLPADILIDRLSSFGLSALSCDLIGQNCVVVGGYVRGVSPGYTVSNGQAPVSYSSNNGGLTWALSNQGAPLPLPANAAIDSTSITTSLSRVYCNPTSLQCVAVGYYSYIGSVGGDSLPLAYTSKDGGTTWALSSTLPLASDSNVLPNVGLNSAH